ncbi:MAG: sulfatase-like hydrolase/transferase [Opitutaceae bacterium]
MVLFWGDHGYQLGEKGKWSKAGSLWEQGTRVPLSIRDPRAAGNGTPSPRVVQSIDIYDFPSLAAVAQRLMDFQTYYEAIAPSVRMEVQPRRSDQAARQT